MDDDMFRHNTRFEVNRLLSITSKLEKSRGKLQFFSFRLGSRPRLLCSRIGGIISKRCVYEVFIVKEAQQNLINHATFHFVSQILSSKTFQDHFQLRILYCFDT